ncbi:MAG: alpha/beta hydrolase family protein [Actinomycetota bacterium]
MIHPIDRLAGLALSRGPRHLRFFSKGWGDASLIDPSETLNSPPAPITIEWLTRSTDSAGHIVQHGTFESPAPHLPHRSKVANVLSISPSSPTDRVVVLMPAWNEHDPKVRVAMARLLADKGVRSLILENPFYGTRHPDPGGGQPIATVSDFMIMGGAAVSEARGILAGEIAEGSSIGVSGYSMGGNTAAIVSATLDLPVATAPLAASHSPGPVFLDGVLNGGIDWEALGGREHEQRLRDALTGVSVLDLDPKPHLAKAIIVRAASDGYVPASATQELVDHWPGSELRVLRGGHASLIWFRKDQLTTAIVDAFNAMEE